MIAYPLFALATVLTPFGGLTPHTNAAPVHVRPSQHILSPMDWRRSPYSSGLIQAHLLRAGVLHPRVAPFFLGLQPNLTCSGHPCVFKPVRASEGGQPVNENPISINPKNGKQLLSGGNDYNCTAIRGHYLSPDGGTSWNRTCDAFPPGANGGDGDPIVGWNTKNTAYGGGIDTTTAGSYEIAVQSSKNKGVSWNTPVTAVTPLFAGGITDKPWLQIDTNASSKFLNRMYVSVTQFDPSNGSQISVSYSSDLGKKWSKAVGVSAHATYPNVNQFSDLAIAADGTVYLTWLNCTAKGAAGDCGGTVGIMMISKSTDGGKTWSKPGTIDKPTLAPDACGCGFYGSLPHTSERVSNIPAAGVDNTTGKTTSGNVYVIDYNWDGTKMVVRVLTSTNGGKTFSKPVNVAGKKPKHDEFFPWLSVSTKGIVGATWLDRRHDPSDLLYEAFGAYSSNAAKFSKNLDLSAKPSNPDNDGFGGGFMGDYTGNSWTGSSLYASWMDTSNGTDAQDDVGGLKK